jgi:hypothetical protein
LVDHVSKAVRSVIPAPEAGTTTFIQEVVAWAQTRYQRVEKTIERVDESWQGDRTVVICAGRLNGVWPNGTPFDNIRFIDRFEVAAGQLMRQDVWNDLGEHRS